MFQDANIAIGHTNTVKTNNNWPVLLRLKLKLVLPNCSKYASFVLAPIICRPCIKYNKHTTTDAIRPKLRRLLIDICICNVYSV